MTTVTVYPSNLSNGSLQVSGFKHLFVGIMCATISMPKTIFTIHNVPNILETNIFIELFKELGIQISLKNKTIVVNTTSLSNFIVPHILTEKIHGALYLMPALLGRMGKVELGDTGGCQIGDIKNNNKRPIEHMLDILQKFGARFLFKDSTLLGYLDSIKQAAVINIMDYSESLSIITGPLISGATKTALLIAIFCKQGKIIIKNPYQKPDVSELVKFLRLAGHDIRLTNEEIIINSENYSSQKSVEFYLLPDFSQIMTYFTLALYCEIELTLLDINYEQIVLGLHHELELFESMGIAFEYQKNKIVIKPTKFIISCKIAVTSCSIYSDHQPFFALLFTKADNVSIITEHVWKKRFGYAKELKKMGFDLSLSMNQLTIKPSIAYRTANCRASDLRAAAVLLIAALKNKVPCKITNIEHLKRGYDNLIGDLKKLGANIKIEEDACA